MGESRYEQIRLGKNIRANLIELKQEIREEAKKRRLAYETGGDYSVFFGSDAGTFSGDGALLRSRLR